MMPRYAIHLFDSEVTAQSGRYNACEVSQERIRQKEAYNAFTEENPTFVGVSEFALRPLINEQDPDIKAEAKQKIGMGLSRGHSMEAENTNLYNITLKAYIMGIKCNNPTLLPLLHDLWFVLVV